MLEWSGLTHAWAMMTAALAVDAFFGEYPNALHPVVAMGACIRFLVKRAPGSAHPVGQLVYGAFMALGVPSAFALLTALLLGCADHRALGAAGPWVAFVLQVYALKASFALTALGRAAREVGRALSGGDLPAARAGLRSLCSRDPSALDEAELVAGAVESVAENASDSFVAPLLFFLVGGIPGAIAYRAVNTLDAMVGYRGRYEYLGKASARLDDLANVIPARLTAGLLLLAGALLGKDTARGLATWRRDAHRTESPNAGRPMAVMAGLLRVRLAKPGHYALGEPLEPLTAGKIGEAWRVVRLAGGLHFVVVVLLVELVVALVGKGRHAF